MDKDTKNRSNRGKQDDLNITLINDVLERFIKIEIVKIGCSIGRKDNGGEDISCRG